MRKVRLSVYTQECCGTQKFHQAPIRQRCWHLFVRLPCARKPKEPALPGRKHFSAGLTVCHPDSPCLDSFRAQSASYPRNILRIGLKEMPARTSIAKTARDVLFSQCESMVLGCRNAISVVRIPTMHINISFSHQVPGNTKARIEIAIPRYASNVERLIFSGMAGQSDLSALRNGNGIEYRVSPLVRRAVATTS
jgi:hypothetical protein